MKKVLGYNLLFSFFILLCINSEAQLGGLMNKVKNKIVDKAIGNSGSQQQTTSPQDDPPCACADAKLIFKFSDNLKIDYKEAVFSVLDDGTILLFNKQENKYYTIKDGSMSGPFEENHSVVKQFEIPDGDTGREQKIEDLITRYRGIIVPSGDKYSIVFGGKTYGPFGHISSFIQNISKTQFAAIVIKDIMVTEQQGRNMEEQMKNAKTDQERMELGMKMAQQMQQRMMSEGIGTDVQPKIVSNVPGAVFDMMKMGGAKLSARVKYDEIVYVGYDKIMDLTGKTLASIDPQKASSTGSYWLSSDNSRFASFNYGTISFSDGKQLSDLFCPRLTRQNDRLFITYMYFSPKNNAIMQCSLPY